MSRKEGPKETKTSRKAVPCGAALQPGSDGRLPGTPRDPAGSSALSTVSVTSAPVSQGWLPTFRNERNVGGGGSGLGASCRNQ